MDGLMDGVDAVLKLAVDLIAFYFSTGYDVMRYLLRMAKHVEVEEVCEILMVYFKDFESHKNYKRYVNTLIYSSRVYPHVNGL